MEVERLLHSRWVTAVALSVVLMGTAAYGPIGGADDAQNEWVAESAEVPTVTPTFVDSLAFLDPVALPFEHPLRQGGPGEPTIKVDDDGTIYMAAMCCEGRASPVWVSRDDGSTFEYAPSPGTSRENGIGTEGDIVLDGNGHAYFIELLLAGFLVTRWSDDGATWDYSVPTAVSSLPDDRPWLADSGQALWLYVNHGASTGIYRSTDGGIVWTPAATLGGPAGTATLPRLFPGHLSADPTAGVVFAAGACTGGFEDTEVCFVHSDDNGATWRFGSIAEPPRGRVSPVMPFSTAVDAAGNLYAAFADADDTGCDVYLAVSDDRARSWRWFDVAPMAGCAAFPWVAAGAPGQVGLSWYQTDEVGHQDRVGEEAVWRPMGVVVEDALSLMPTVNFGVVDRVAHEGPLLRALRDFQQVDVGPDGRIHIGFASDVGQGCAGVEIQELLLNDKCTFYVGQADGPRAV